MAIIGAGPVVVCSRYSNAVCSEMLATIDAPETTGGQCAALYPEKPIYDIPGHPAIDAAELINKLEKQAAPFHPAYHLGQQIRQLTQNGERWLIETSKGVCDRRAGGDHRRRLRRLRPGPPAAQTWEKYEGQQRLYLVKRRGPSGASAWSLQAAAIWPSTGPWPWRIPPPDLRRSIAG